jgi:hypothetical protein
MLRTNVKSNVQFVLILVVVSGFISELCTLGVPTVRFAQGCGEVTIAGFFGKGWRSHGFPPGV